MRLLNPIHGSTPEEEESSSDEEVLGIRVLALRNDNIEEGSNLEYTELCQIKQGFLNLVTDYQPVSPDQPNMGANLLPLLSIKKVFVVLNKQTLSIFENSNVNSLIKTINVAQIGSNMRPKRLESANCF